MDFTLTPEINDMCRRIRSFVDEHLLPLESDPTIYDEYESIRKELLDALRVKAKAAGVWALSMPKERGGAGYNTVGMAACYEEMNRALFGPAVFNAAAPDDGNMFVLNRLGNDRQKEKWLQPIIDGDVSSSIVMTEPAPGAGSDPAGMMKTTAEKSG